MIATPYAPPCDSRTRAGRRREALLAAAILALALLGAGAVRLLAA